jgi:hypothetical protein
MFFIKTTAFLSLIALSLLTGCAMQPISLTQQAQKKIDSVDGVLIIPQNNLIISVPSTNGSGGGLIGVLVAATIDSVKQSNAEKNAAPLIENLKYYDFRKVMLDASNQATENTEKNNVIKIKPLRLETVASDSAKRIAFDKTDAGAIIFCNVGYRIESGNLIVSALTEIYPKNSELKQFRNKPDEKDPLSSGNAIYRKNFYFAKQAVDKDNIKEALSEAAISVSQQIVDDVNHGI